MRWKHWHGSCFKFMETETFTRYAHFHSGARLLQLVQGKWVRAINGARAALWPQDVPGLTTAVTTEVAGGNGFAVEAVIAKIRPLPPKFRWVATGPNSPEMRRAQTIAHLKTELALSVSGDACGVAAT
jgi:hypothetical protein